MGEWRDTTLGKVLELKRGYDLPQRDRHPGRVPLVSSSGVTDYHSDAMVKGPGVVTGRYGTLGRVFYIAEDFWPLNTALYVRDFKGNDARFISYFLRLLDFFAYSDKAAVPGINRNHLHRARIRFPVDLAEQRAIAHILGALDDKIELNRRMSATLEAMARAMFDAHSADAQEGGDTEPSTLLDVAAVLSGGTPSTSEPNYWGGDVLWASAKDVSQCEGPLLTSTERTITRAGLANSPTQVIPQWATVVVARGATTGRHCLLGADMAMNQTCYALCAPAGEQLYLYCLFGRTVGQLVQAAHGSVFDTITTATLRTTPVWAAPRAARQAFDRRVAPLFARILGNCSESEILRALRDTLLPKLLSGELRLKDAERLAAAAA